MNTRAFSVATFLCLCLLPSWMGAQPAAQPRLETIAERSNFTATSKHEDVLDFCAKLAKASPIVRQAEMGVTLQGRKLPLLILADPPISTPEEARKSGKLIVFAMGNIHAGEVDGKEGLLMLARDLALAKERPLLKNLIVLIAPNFNADGGDKFGKNRPRQAGPDQVGTRENAQGFDLNRDFVKLESPEVQALVRLFRQWDPAMFIDCHTTNGSYHRYMLTYDGPRHPSNYTPLTSFVSDSMLPDVGKRLEKASGFKSFFYGNFAKQDTQWQTIQGLPRYSTHYAGFRNRIGILSESYMYAPYRDRVLASRAFVKACFEYAADNNPRIRTLVAAADKANRSAPKQATVALRHKLTTVKDKVTILGLEGGKTIETGKPRDVRVDFYGGVEATLAVSRPAAYLFPASNAKAVENLQRHGIDVEELREDVELDLEAYRVDKISLAKPFQKHNQVSLEAKVHKESRRIPAGTILVRTGQNLGNLASFLLEPQSEDGLVTWNFFDKGLKEGQDFPVLRLPANVPLVTTKVRPLPEDRGPKKSITSEMLDNGTLPNLIGDAVAGLEWLDDDHFMQVKKGQLLKVHAATGRSTPYTSRKLVEINVEDDGTGPAADAQGKGKGAVDLRSPSPSGKHAAFVRNNNLFVEDTAGKKEIPLTKDGSELIFNGRADWVYFEEVFNRSRKAYWWSPDGQHLAFLRTDDGPVPKATVIDFTKPKQLLEVTAYPRSGEPNPLIKLGIGSVAGQVRWADLAEYAKDDGFLITKVGWLPDSKTAYFCVQDRCQMWLDFCTVGVEGGKPAKLFRDTTKAWVEPPLVLFLPDGTFLASSEKTGWKHIYHHAKDGKLKGPVTKGDWELRSVQRFDKDTGFVYFSGTKDNLIGNNAFRIKLDGTGLERIGKGKGKGTDTVSFNPRGDLFINTYSDLEAPPRVSLHKSDGTLVRVLDTNPVYEREEIQMGEFKRVQIPTPDGFILEATVLKPAGFDAQKKYPVWFKTYGGPHAPEIRDTAGKGGGAADQALANAGYIVMHCDPRSASGKGAVSTWTCYKQMGIQELKDIETAIKWLTANPWADAKRVGMSGHSYGGFMTAFALTHSKLFACGIAGAPPTDWHNYDSIYTERYMQTPQMNPKGYESTSIVKAAKDIHGRLLLAHGLKDDNVHVQNTIQLMNALQLANKDFEVMLYPTARHGIGGVHYQRLTREFMKRNLQP